MYNIVYNFDTKLYIFNMFYTTFECKYTKYTIFTKLLIFDSILLYYRLGDLNTYFEISEYFLNIFCTLSNQGYFACIISAIMSARADHGRDRTVSGGQRRAV